MFIVLLKWRLKSCFLSLPTLAFLAIVFADAFMESAMSKTESDKTVVSATVEGNAAFALDLYAKLKTKKGNFLFSPYSVSTAFALTYAGARGNTAKQMSNALRFALDGEQLHAAFSQLEDRLNAIQKRKAIEVNLANALWVHKEYAFLKKFLKIAKRRYKARADYADFTTAYERAREKINAWVERQTNKKIKNLLKTGDVNSMTRLVLVNAIYFKGDWVSRFKKTATKDIVFWTSMDVGAEVSTMTQEGEFNYAENELAQILELPYEGNDLSMIVLLPKKIDGLDEVEGSLNVKTLNQWLSGLRKHKVRVYLPRFKISSSFNLSNALTSMGMKDAFGEGADFSGVVEGKKLNISAAIHEAFVEVNEEGTEAAAATGVVMGITSAPSPPKVFRADHPFVFLIRENRFGSVLFLGRTVNPKE